MPTICVIRGIKIYINWNDHMPPHFHAMFAGQDVLIDIETLEAMGKSSFPSRQLKIVLGWAACHQQELRENWDLARAKETLYDIPPTL
jgi:hypothetical protein